MTTAEERTEPTETDGTVATRVEPEDAVAPESAALGDRLVLLDDPDHPRRRTTDIVSWVVVGLTCAVVAATMHPEWIVQNTTATGGDMGAHVWGPAFLRDELLPSLRLSGWSPDWYAGFPAYVFYMVVPSLMIVALDVGLPWWLLPFGLAAVAGGTWWALSRTRSPVLRTLVWIVAGVLTVLFIPLPYNVAFKLVTVLGIVTMPLAGFALGRAARLPFPGPPLIALGATAFLYETGFTIYGGNIPSTMAGEFAFSISLTLAVLYLAVLVRGVRTGWDRALGAVLFGLVILCHLIPAIFAAIATVVYLFTRREDRTPWWDSSTTGRVAAGVAVALTLLSTLVAPSLFPYLGTIVVVALFVGFDSRTLRWAAVVGPVGFLVAAFWFIPFYLNSTYLNDMGWEKLTEYSRYLWPDPAVFDMPYRNVVFALAALGAVLSMVHRVRLGWWLSLLIVTHAWVFVLLPQYRLWNARILPFYILCLYLLAALAVGLIVRSLALVVGDVRRERDEPAWVGVTGLVTVFVVMAVSLAGALRVLPGAQNVADPSGSGATSYQWLGITFPKQNISSGWAYYNFQGLESRPAYPEYEGVVATMEEVAAQRGCGRAMWEYEKELDRFGTPMALMLLPYFTDGCIGSMEGLYFEASSTTPYHFLNQSELSTSPSRAQRDLPYGEFNIGLGTSHLQLLGVKYYMATSEQAIAAARTEPRLTEVAAFASPDTGDGVQRNWVVFEVADSGIVSPLEFQPVVAEDADDHVDGWVYGERPEAQPGQARPPKSPGPAVEWYLDPERWDVPLATSGPDDWARVPADDPNPPRQALPPVEVSAIDVGTDEISFRVDQVGVPVLVKASYFPNWRVEGAEGPYRVAPNQMVVIPTEQQVTLHYGTSWIDVLGWLLALVGFACVGWLAVDDQRRRDAAALADAEVPDLVAAGAVTGGGAAGDLLVDDPPADDADADADDDPEDTEAGSGTERRGGRGASSGRAARRDDGADGATGRRAGARSDEAASAADDPAPDS